MKASTPLLFLSGALAAPSGDVEARQSCAKLHVIGARETTVPQGFGSSQAMIQLIQGAYPGTTSEAIVCTPPPPPLSTLHSLCPMPHAPCTQN